MNLTGSSLSSHPCIPIYLILLILFCELGLEPLPFSPIFTGTKCTGPITVQQGQCLCDDSYRSEQELPFKSTKVSTELTKNTFNSRFLLLNRQQSWTGVSTLLYSACPFGCLLCWYYDYCCLIGCISFHWRSAVQSTGNQSRIQRNQMNSLSQRGKYWWWPGSSNCH